MTVCRGTVRRGRRCGALAEPGTEHCTAHLLAAGYRRCPVHGWTQATINGWCKRYEDWPSCETRHFDPSGAPSIQEFTDRNNGG